MVTETFYIDGLDITKLEHYRKYCIFADGAVQADMVKSYKNALSSIFLVKERPLLQEGLRSAMLVMENAKQIYIHERNFDIVQKDWPYLGFVHDDFLRYYGMN